MTLIITFAALFHYVLFLCSTARGCFRDTIFTYPAISLKLLELCTRETKEIQLHILFIFYSWVIIVSYTMALNSILYQWYFVSTLRKNCSRDRERICIIFEITRTINSNSERSGQFLVTECFFKLFLDVSHI